MHIAFLLILLAALLSYKNSIKPINVHPCVSKEYPETCDKINVMLASINTECKDCLKKSPAIQVYVTADIIDESTLGVAKVGATECLVMIDPRNTVSMFQTLIHELGHCKGYDHVDNPNSVMYYQESEVSEETTKDFIRSL